MKHSLLIFSALSFVTIASTAFLGGCKSTKSSQISSIIGEDERTSSTRLGAFIGRIFNGEKSCTAFISGSNEILTAAHCFSESDDLLAFKFQTQNGGVFPIEAIKAIYQQADVISLKSPVGEAFLKTKSPKENSKKLSLIGFDPTSSRFVESSKGIMSQQKGLIFHTLDTVPGMSGSPLLDGDELIGIHIGYLPKSRVNLGISIEGLRSGKLPQILEPFQAEFKLKIPKKIGGTIGQVIGSVTNPIVEGITAPAADALGELTNSALCEPFGLTGAAIYVGAAGGMQARHSAGEALPDNFKAALRAEFGGLVDEVEVHYNANPWDEFTFTNPFTGSSIRWTHGSAGQTYGNHIYINLSKDATPLALLAHELVHTRQWASRGRNLSEFGRDYFNDWCKAGFSYSKNNKEEEAGSIEVRY